MDAYDKMRRRRERDTMQEIQKILDSYTEEIKRIYGQHLHKILLYGSYARGEETRGSDIDIMILVDLDEFSIKNYVDSLNEVTFDMNLDNDIMLMPIVKNEEHFEKWISFYPFYRNVSQEGVALYAA